MSQLSGTYETYESIGNREDLEDVIYNIAPEETPFLSAIGKVKCKSTKHEWQTDSLAAQDESNYAVEGDEFSFADPDPTVRVGNFCQISKKTAMISGTLEAVDRAGRDSEMSYQIAKRGKELKIDVEAILLKNQASVAGTTDGGSARKLGGLQSWLATNVDDDGTAGHYDANTGLTVAAINGTQRAFDEDQIKAVMQSCKTSGGNPSILSVGVFNKSAFSQFDGISLLRREAKGKSQAVIDGAADMYISDFGTLSVVTNIRQPARAAFLLDPEMAAVGYLRPFKTVDIAKTGDAEKKGILVEYTLVVKNEAAHGVIADLTTS